MWRQGRALGLCSRPRTWWCCPGEATRDCNREPPDHQCEGLQRGLSPSKHPSLHPDHIHPEETPAGLLSNLLLFFVCVCTSQKRGAEVNCPSWLAAVAVMHFPDDCLLHVMEPFPPLLDLRGLRSRCTSKETSRRSHQESFHQSPGVLAVLSDLCPSETCVVGLPLLLFVPLQLGWDAPSPLLATSPLAGRASFLWQRELSPSEPLPVRRAESLVVAQPTHGGASEGAGLLKALWI